MKILILYTARSGTNSIAKYFMKQNPHFVYYNQPWSFSDISDIQKISYEESINHENVLIKNTFSNLGRHKIEKDMIVRDFDKIILISRKDKHEQTISYLIAQKDSSFLQSEKRGYYIEGISENNIDMYLKFFTDMEIKMQEFLEYGAELFYYEDLYYGDGFKKLFSFLDLKFIQEDFDAFLDIKNRYKNEEIKSKKTKTLL